MKTVKNRFVERFFLLPINSIVHLFFIEKAFVVVFYADRK